MSSSPHADLFGDTFNCSEAGAHAYTQFSQGREANESGQFVEQCIVGLAERRGYTVFDNHRSTTVQGNLLKPNERMLIRNVGYRNLIGNRGHTEFLIVAYGRQVRIDCKGQNEGGSTYQKVGWMLLDARDAMTEKEIIYVVHGRDKTWKRAYRWLKEECRHFRKKQILVLTLEEYQAWFKRFDEGKV